MYQLTITMFGNEIKGKVFYTLDEAQQAKQELEKVYERNGMYVDVRIDKISMSNIQKLCQNPRELATMLVEYYCGPYSDYGMFETPDGRVFEEENNTNAREDAITHTMIWLEAESEV